MSKEIVPVKIGKRGNPNWKKGVSGNPAGREKGTRNRFAESFLKDFAEHWAENGKEALDRIYRDDPASYGRMAVAILPKLIDLSDDTKEAILVMAGLPFDSVRKRLEYHPSPKEEAITVEPSLPH